MFEGASSVKIWMINFALMIVWHMLTLVLCINISSRFFSPKRFLYLQQRWEKNGAFYVKTLHIKKWKDYLPQYVAKDGFSKKKLKQDAQKDLQYINMFIIETCRAEWNHVVCCMYWIVSFFVNSFCYAVIFSLIPVLANLPFIAIQRYNRIRLQKLVDKRIRTSSHTAESGASA